MMQTASVHIVRSLKMCCGCFFFGDYMKKLLNYFTKFEISLWCSSILFILISFLLFDRNNHFTLISSLVGVTSLILCAKGNPWGQVLMILFSTFYGFTSYTFSYYGEMITYLCMTLPMSVIALVSWLKNPYNGNRSEVKVSTLKRGECLFLCLLASIVTLIFYFVLDHFNTANIIPSTFSVTTSFVAVYLTFRRSPYFALAYATNDVVLIVLWVLASITDIHYISVVVCFVAFLANDVYGFINWLKMKKRQS